MHMNINVHKIIFFILPRAVMVKFFYAIITNRTMNGSYTPIYIARITIFEFVKNAIN